MNTKESNIQINGQAGLGDSIAWVPYIDSYQQQTKKNVFCKINNSEIFAPMYDNIHFLEKNSKDMLNTTTICGYPYNRERHLPLQHLAAVSLGIDYIGDLRPKIYIKNKKSNFNRPYVCIGAKSTCQAKFWNNPTGWDQTIFYLRNLGYEVVCIDQHSTYGSLEHNMFHGVHKNVIDKTSDKGNFTLHDRITDLLHCSFFIGLCSGLSWLSWALNKPTIMIGGFTDPKIEFYTPYRVINKNVCTNCWEEHGFDRSDWLWCPRKKGTEDIFECSKKISFEMVKEKIDFLIKDNF
jgi:autotransporter strand-loop-strand O-heptosyltransferase